jgi:hypothetical protein
VEERIIGVFGAPDVLVSDGGPQLTRNSKVRTMLDYYGVQPHTSVPYSPQSHGTVERSVQSVSSLLRIMINQTGLPWHKLLNLVQLTLNTMPLPSLGNQSSMFFMFGRDSTDIRNDMKLNEFMDPAAVGAFWKKHAQICKDLTTKWREDYAIRSRKGGKILSYPKGSLVYLKDFYQHEKPKKWPLYVATPVTVVKEFDSVVLVKDFKGRILSRHKNTVKKCHPRIAELYQPLPRTIKFKLGDPFSV